MTTLPIYNLKVENPGDLAKEVILFKVSEDFDIGRLIVADNTYDKDDQPSNKLRHMHAFKHQIIKEDEMVALWTKHGSYNESKSAKGAKMHNFYWNLGQTVWNQSGDVAHIIDVRSVLNHRIPPSKKE